MDGIPGSGLAKTPDGEFIPGIIRFPLPAPLMKATGMTGVAAPNTVFGSLIGSEEFYALESGAIVATPDEPAKTPAKWPPELRDTGRTIPTIFSSTCRHGPLSIGGEDVTTVDEALEILGQKGNAKDASNALAKHLLATKLNVSNNSTNNACIADAVAEADAFLAANPPGSDLTKADRAKALGLKDLLDEYNNGTGLCFPAESVVLSSGFTISGSGFVPLYPLVDLTDPDAELCR